MACSKDTATKSDERLNESSYCNDPEAVNYNVNFPGKPDNTLCYFPTQLFKGNYTLIDSILDVDSKLSSIDSFPVTLNAIDNIHLSLVGFCKGTTDELRLTADKYYKAIPDSSTLVDYNNSKLNGTFICGKTSDTLTGYIQKYNNDSLKILVRFTIATDTGYSFHFGTAIKR